MRKFGRHIFLLLLLVPAMLFQASATSPILKVSLDSAYVLMGKATPLNISLVKDVDDRGQLVVPPDSMCGAVEILTELKSDTSNVGSGRVQIDRTLMLQSFDSGLYILKPILYINGADTIASQRLALKVIPAMIDSLTTIHDYADVRDVNRKFIDYLPDFIADYGLWIIAFLALFVGGWYAVRRYLRRSAVDSEPVVCTVPPYEQAIAALNILRTEKLCEQGREKEFYTRLTEILRTYLARRFSIYAMEMTSEQIRQMLARNSETRHSKKYVDQVLEVADFVKFAKMRPLPDDNNRAFSAAMQFVEETKPTPAPAEEIPSVETPKVD